MIQGSLGLANVTTKLYEGDFFFLELQIALHRRNDRARFYMGCLTCMATARPIVIAG